MPVPATSAAPAAPDTQELILAAADRLVAESGVANLTFDELARRAGVSKGGVLYHFRSKDALIEAMVARFIARFDEAVETAAKADPEPAGRHARAYVAASFPAADAGAAVHNKANGAITAALANMPERLAPVRAQGARHQAALQADGLDPVLATIIRLATDGLWLGENFDLMRLDPDLREKVVARLTSWTAAGLGPDRRNGRGDQEP